MKKSHVTISLVAIIMMSVSVVRAKDCIIPNGGKVTFSFESEGSTCSFTQDVSAKSTSPGTYTKINNKTTKDSYISVTYGCNEQGEWAIDESKEKVCKNDDFCSAETNLTFNQRDTNGNSCELKVGGVPKTRNGGKVSFQYGTALCLNYRFVFSPKTNPFICPEGGVNSNESAVSSNDSVIGQSCELTGCNDLEVTRDEAGNSNSDESENAGDGEGTSLLAEGHGSNDQITAAAAAFGAAMSDKCEMGSKVKSLKTYSDAFKSYHSLVLKNVEIHEKGLLRMEQRSKELVELTQTSESSLIQVESLKFQRDSIQLMIDLYMNDKTGTYKGKLDLLMKMSKSQEEALNEFKAMNKSMLVCDGQTAVALDIARTGCQRTKIVETCNDDGTECEDTIVRDPVEGSCLALEMIPQSLKIKEELYNLQFEVMPSNLLVTGQENIAKNYIRYVSSSIPTGAWQAPLVNCSQVLDQTHIDYGVKCETPQGDLANSKEWGVPVEGRLVSDLFAGILDRLPDTGGDDYWQRQYDRIIASGKTAAEATAEIRNHIANSNENQGIPDTEEEKQRRLDSNKERGIVSVRCEDATCGRGEAVASSVDADKWYGSIEEQARFEDLINSEEGQISVDDLKKLGFDKFEKGDLLVGAPYGRMELVPQLSELVTESVREDLKVVEELTKNKNEIVTMLNNLHGESAGTSTGGSGISSGLSTGTSSSASLSNVEQTTQALSPIDTDSLLQSVASASAVNEKLDNESEGALKKFEPPKSIMNKIKPILEKIKLSNKAASRGSYNIKARKSFANSTNSKVNKNKDKIDESSDSEIDLSKISRSGFASTGGSSGITLKTQSPSSTSTSATDAASSSHNNGADSSFGGGLTGMDFSEFDDNSVIPVHDRDKVKKLRRASSSSYSNSGRMPSSVARGHVRRGGSLSSGQSQLGSGHGMQRSNTYSVDNSNEINKPGISLFKIISKRYANSKLYPKK